MLCQFSAAGKRVHSSAADVRLSPGCNAQYGSSIDVNEFVSSPSSKITDPDRHLHLLLRSSLSVSPGHHHEEGLQELHHPGPAAV